MEIKPENASESVKSSASRIVIVVAKQILVFILALFYLLLIGESIQAKGQEKPSSGVFIRFKVVEPTGEKFRVAVDGFRHAGEPWYLPNISADVSGAAWSEWLDLSQWPWHGRINRSGGIAEYPSTKLSVSRLDSSELIKGCILNVQLAEKPDEKSIVVSFTERSDSNTMAFLVPYPLRENAKEFETGSQMTARHWRWANEATGGKPIVLKKFDLITQLWGHYDPALERQAVSTLQLLGFNVLGNVNSLIGREKGMRTYGHTWLYAADPETVTAQWETFSKTTLKYELTTEEGQWKYRTMPHWVLSDEVSGLDFRGVETNKLNGWFRDFLKSRGATNEELSQPIERVEYPAAAMFEKTLPREAPLSTRRLMYYASKFGHWWSARQLKQTSDLIRQSLPGMKTETLLPSHGFMGNAWGPANIGMSYRMLDIFELGAQESLNQLSAEDWFGLNHMYGPEYTWTGGQTFGYYNAILRSATADKPMMLRGLITPSDDKYLQLKAHSSLAQGAKSFFFWTFGPTYISTENYWSDLRSEYDGIAKLNGSLQKAEDVLYPAKPVTDPVAILYSVSHDLWHTDNHAAFVEKRLVWHALRHLHVQPNFLREEDVETGKLKNYKVLYITDWCVSRKASAAIDKWVQDGGILYLSAGAATRDEFYEPYVPPFAKTVWIENAAQQLVTEKHNYNERTDLPKIKPLTTATVRLGNRQFNLPVIGVRLKLLQNSKQFANFSDGTTAGVIIPYGRGQVIGLGFLPMLAYGQLANFKPTTLEEKWIAEPRDIVKMALDTAKITPVAKADVPVVETSLLTGPNGSALVLANYTYQPIDSLTIDVKLSEPVKQVISTEGSKVQLQTTGQSDGRIRLKVIRTGR